MFKRVFQHYEGSIKELQGQSIASFFSIEDEHTGNVYLLWLQVSPDNKWYRIYIDGMCCSVDEYAECMVEDDKDDFVIVRDLTPKYRSIRILRASVSEPGAPNCHMVLSIHFQNLQIELICKTEDGVCTLRES